MSKGVDSSSSSDLMNMALEASTKNIKLSLPEYVYSPTWEKNGRKSLPLRSYLCLLFLIK